MSHHATNWAIQQRGLRPATKIVLWHLCDRHNPDFGCFPTQDRLAQDCEISRSALNEHLTLLEGAGLLRRMPRLDPATKRQLPTRYILGFEPGFTPRDVTPCPKPGHGCGAGTDPGTEAGDVAPSPFDQPDPRPDSGHGNPAGAVSGNHPEPCPENAESRVRIPDTNPVREPLREPVKEEEDARAREAISDEFFGELLSALGLDATALPSWWQGWPARLHVRRWIDEFGLSEDRILETATATRRDHPNPPDGPKALDRAMERAARYDVQAAAEAGSRKPARKRRSDPGPLPSEDERAGFYARIVNSDGFLPPSMISNSIREAMLARGLVTEKRLRERGVL